ncbi:hypothetical protein V8G54_009308, partial [Vigna mungo]
IAVNTCRTTKCESGTSTTGSTADRKRRWICGWFVLGVHLRCPQFALRLKQNALRTAAEAKRTSQPSRAISSSSSSPSMSRSPSPSITTTTKYHHNQQAPPHHGSETEIAMYIKQ